MRTFIKRAAWVLGIAAVLYAGIFIYGWLMETVDLPAVAERAEQSGETHVLAKQISSGIWFWIIVGVFVFIGLFLLQAFAGGARRGIENLLAWWSRNREGY